MPAYKGATQLIAILLLLISCGTTVVPPILLESGRMVYPPESRDANVEGSVLVAYTVNEDGEVSNVRVLSSTPEGVFDEAAIDFVRTWLFQPQKRSGVPEVVENVQSRISFTLEDGEASYLEFIE
ncbi:MAG: energy transducer TonB [Gammaproteobacteria bacterium]|nr:energy transducer TonB [Gammaproteobacteria bacterium]